MKDLLHKYEAFRWLDFTTDEHQKLYTAKHSFALDDALAQSVGDQQSLPTVRLWLHDPTVVLGIPDARLPYIAEGITVFDRNIYDVIVRNSGGLAVILDPGVLNISIILPNAKKLSIDEAYEWMYAYITHMFSDLTDEIEAYEIVGSYCPGDYDLSIRGVKFAGLSQRRIKDGVSIQIYIDITGDSHKRATLIRSFYDKSKRDAELTFNYPTVESEKMGNLARLLGEELTVKDVAMRAKHSLIDIAEEVTFEEAITDNEKTIFDSRLKMMEQRNEQLQEMLYK
ncbi:MAG TPA: lipoate--protein ligase family protein [Bacillota bacterium]|nr:lipoate--protein ligase family protein [Bacillota bacterium]